MMSVSSTVTSSCFWNPYSKLRPEGIMDDGETPDKCFNHSIQVTFTHSPFHFDEPGLYFWRTMRQTSANVSRVNGA